MATHSIPSSSPPGSPEPEQPLTREEGWDLIFSLYGSAKEMFAEVGGSEAWVRFLRDENEDENEEPETPGV